MADQLAQAFSVKNLKRCWNWIRTNPEAGYKNYFRHIYSSYELGIDKHIDALSAKLRSGVFQPTFADKLFFPKASGLLRPWSLLAVEDQIAYLAAVSMIAGRLLPQTQKYHLKSVFGNLYAGKNCPFFYRDWRECYRAYTDAMRTAYADGYRWIASFDLTACFDSIDHHLLQSRLGDIGTDADLVSMLLRWLRHWTAHDHCSPVYLEHGIPQGPLASGLLSEVVLSYFDSAPRDQSIVYLRYVDDIRLFGQNEKAIRRQLIDLDRTSKSIGLFPQSGKIKIHTVDDIEDEVKSISNPPEDLYDDDEEIDRRLVHARLLELSRGLKIDNETRFKYVLARAEPSAILTKRLLQLLQRYPHLHGTIGRHLEKSSQLSKVASKQAMGLLRDYDLYPAFTASLLRAMRGRLHRDFRGSLTKYCQDPFKGNRKGPSNPELRAALASVVIASGSVRWTMIEKLATWSGSWWVRAELLPFVRVDLVGPATAGSLANRLLRDSQADPSSVAADFLLKHGLVLERPYKDVHACGQHALRAAKVTGRLHRNEDPIQDFMVETLGDIVKSIDWRAVLGGDYKSTLPKIARWRAYSTTDATSWINLSDTIMDLVLSRLFAHDGSIGTYTLGKIGSVLNTATGRFASAYPALYSAAQSIHDLRLESDLSHPITKSTGRPTGFIRFSTMQKVKPALANGFAEMWSQW